MSSRSPAQIATIAAVTAITGLVGYAVYFDYMRRNNAQFRQSIKKQHKQIRAAAEQRTKAEKERNSRLLKEALAEVHNEATPTSPEQQEVYFQEQVAEGEKLAALGPDQYVASAAHFYRALRVYPQPVELLMIYQKVVPPPVFTLLIEFTQIAGNAPEAGSGSGSGPFAIPPAAAASVSDIDDHLSGQDVSPTGSSNEWDKLSEGA